ncbi:MAG: type II secretion system protein M [Paucibacter sp.]|nr:type II secretion system protein M [Roseateles sp.]
MNELFAPLRQRLDALEARERRALLMLAWAVGLGLLFLVALRPAWQTVRAAPLERERLEQSQLEMQAQAAEAASLRAVPAVPAEQARQALAAACARLGPTAQLVVSGSRAQLGLHGLRSEDLSALLAEARSAARARAVEAQLQRGPDGFSGTLTLVLPGDTP